MKNESMSRALALGFFDGYNLALKPPAAEKLMTAFEVSRPRDGDLP